MRREVGAVPAGWVELHRELGTQYLAGDLGGGPEGVVTEPLGVTDAADMTALAAETEPGPYGVDGWRTGGYVGVRRSGRLVAMAGERFRAPGWAEVSGVCVHPSARGQGLGAAVTLAVAEGIRARGDRALLHVREHNATARRLYERLGFVERATVDVVVARRTGDRRHPAS
jgi:ribosomal protein S18 acetylase RimI-like enzyme